MPNIFAVANIVAHPVYLATVLILLALLLAEDWAVRPLVRTMLVGLSLLLYTRYLIWRGLYTLNHANVFAYGISVTLYAAEIYGYITLWLFYLQGLWPRKRTAVPFDPEIAPTVDVFITIYDEDLEILRTTLTAAAALDYPRDRLKIYVLDDGRRAEVQALAREFGSEYVTRENNRHAKAGNINHALPLTSGEVIAFFDCDHVPVRSFLKETVGFFRDPKVAIVQTPHNFYNLDSFQRNLFLEHRLCHEQEMFYEIILPGRDRFNSVFFAGTSGLMRRSALEEAGGFQVWSVIEDLYTSMELHAHGWKSVYYDRRLTGGLSPESFHAYLRQHQRWSRGGVQVFVKDNPLLKRGLTWMQRLHYSGSLFYFFHGIVRMVYLFAPLPYLYFGFAPIDAPAMLLLVYFLPYYISSHAAFGLMTRRFRNPFWSDVYDVADGFAVARTELETLLLPEKLLFQVTPKGISHGGERTHLGHLLPHFITGCLLAGGIVFTLIRLAQGGAHAGVAFISLAWASYNILLIGVAMAAGRERPSERRHHRLMRRLRTELGSEDGTLRGWSHDVSESGLSAFVRSKSHPPARVRAVVKCRCGDSVRLQGSVAWCCPWGKAGWKLGVRFNFLEREQLHALRLILFSCPHSWEHLPHAAHRFTQSVNYMVRAFEHLFDRRTLKKERVGRPRGALS